MNNPAISVILPVYNPGKGIRKCIRMLQAQTLANIEMLFVDDCGTDDSMDAVREAAAADARIRILTNRKNIGAGASRNRGIEEAKGEYLSFIDPDDYPEKDFLELLYKKAEKTKADIVKGERVLIDFAGKRIPSEDKTPLNTSIRFGLCMGGQIYGLFTYNHWTAIYRRKFLLAHGIRYGLTRNSQDTTFLLRVGKYAQSISFEDRALYCYVSREGSRMRDFSRERLENELAAFDDQMREMATCDTEHYSFYKYIFNRIIFLLRIHAALRLQDEELAKWFLAEIKRAALNLPWIEQIVEMNLTVRAFILYDSNLSSVPYRAQGVDSGIEAWIFAVKRITCFLKEHPEEAGSYGWLVRSCWGNTLWRLGNRKLNKEERQKAYLSLKECFEEFPNPALLTDRKPLIRLFLKTGINLIPVKQTIQESGRRTGLNVMAEYFTGRDA